MMNRAIATPPGEETIYATLTSDEMAERLQEESQPIVYSLETQLDSIFSSLSLEQQADFSPLKAAVKLELELGNQAIAKLIIERATVPEELESVRQNMLSRFED